jgi:amidohydrolase
MEILDLARAEFPETVRLRRYFHENPELSNEEVKTIAYLEQYLQQLGIKTINVPDGGLIGVINSGKPGKTLLMRADTDALPIAETPQNLKGPKVCVSHVAGCSHACGHDAHMAMLLTAARILQAHKESWKGQILLCFERGEEKCGDIQNLLPWLVKQSGFSIDGCYATHVRWDMPAGTVSITPGGVMAGGCSFIIRIEGRFGHGARPDLANSPIDCFHTLYGELNAFRMRHIEPFECFTFSLGFVHSGSDKYNVVPQDLTFGGTARFFNYEKAGRPFEKFLIRTLDKVTELHDCTYTIEHMPQALYEVSNHPVCAELGRRAVIDALGAKAVKDPVPWMASESFSLYQQLYPGVLSFTGIANAEKGCGANHHTPEFDIDETGMMSGAAMAVSYALAFLNYDKAIPFTPTTRPVEELARRNV